ncbi:MAG TPA: hypothetical protein VEL74_24840, partial [Thermoanaerobaculia bacterium]|nr:hypothetical protein [Thermoanaerobaculia bacterium]
MSRSALGPVLRFHLRVGVRIAMLILAPVLVGAVGGGVLLGDDFLDSFSRMLYGSGSSGGSAVLIALACLGVASTAAPRICRGLDGWLRHLPVDGLTHRRAAAVAIAVSQTPLLAFLLFLSLFATRITAPSVIDALALPVTALGAALWAVPAERGVLTKILGLAGAIAAGSGGWRWLAA